MDNHQIQTIVVHVDQLTPENMTQLAQAGYTIVRDASLLIFGRNLSPQDQEATPSTENPVVEGEVVTPVAPTPIQGRNSKRHN